MKTRLIPTLGKNGATQLYRKLLHRLVGMLVSEKLADIELWCSPNSSHPDFQQIQLTLGCSLYSQVGEDLGERMSYAVQEALARYLHVILIGVDCPGLTIDLLSRVICYLNEGAQAVLVPAEDGGYVLLGLNKTAKCLFDGVPWGTEVVAGHTRKCLQYMGWNWLELPELWDVDRPEDLLRLSEFETRNKDGEVNL